MSKLKKLNRLNKSKTLSVALSVGLVASNLVSAVPAFAATSTPAHTASIANKVSSTVKLFNKLVPEDVEVTLTTASELTAIKNGSKALVEGTDYTLEGDVVTLSATYLGAQKNGTLTLKFDFENGADPTLRLTISNSSAKLSPATATFNNLNNKGKDASATVYTYGIPLAGILYGETELAEGTDYTLGTPSTTGSQKVTIKKSFLSTLAEGKQSLKFNFEAGTDPVLTVNVSHNTPVPSAVVKSVSAVTDTVNDTVTVQFDKAVTDASKLVLKQKVDAKDVQTIPATFTLAADGLSATAKVKSVVATTADQTVVYSVSYNGGAAVIAAETIIVKAVVVDTEKPVITLVGDATMNLKVGDTFTDPGVTVTDNVDKDLVAVVSGDVVDASKAGTYVIKYNVSDKAGNAAVEVTRTVVVAPAALTVSTVSAITKTTVTTKLATAPATDLTDADAAKFAVLADGKANVVTKVEKDFTDITNKTYKLTLTTSLDKTQGNLTVNGVAPATKVVTGSDFDYDFKAPSAVSVTAKGNKSVVVKFDEKMSTTGTALGNFKLVKTDTPATNLLDNGSGSVGTAVLSADKTEVTLTLEGAKVMVPAQYTLVLGNGSTVKDLATNAIYNGTEVGFAPTADQLQVLVAPGIATAVYNNGKGELTLTFDKNVTSVDVTKLSINGVALVSDDTVTTTGNSSVIKLSTATKAKVDAITDALVLTSAKDAYTDGTNATTGETAAISKVAPAVISSGSYNQETNVITLNFDQKVKIADQTKLKLNDDTTSDEATLASATKADGTAYTATELATAGSTWAFKLSDTEAGKLEATANDKTKVKAYMDAGAVTNDDANSTSNVAIAYAKGGAVTYAADSTKPFVKGVTFDYVTTPGSGTEGDASALTIELSEKSTVNGSIVIATAATGDPNQVSLTLSSVATDTKNKIAINYATLTSTNVTKLKNLFESGKDIKVFFAKDVITDDNTLKNDVVTFANGLTLAYNDYVKPAVSGEVAVKDNTHLVVSFTEPMDATSANIVANYVITDATGTSLNVVSALLQDDKKSLLLTTAAQTANKPYTVKVTGVKDVKGNIITDVTKNFLGDGSVIDTKLAIASGSTVVIYPNAANDVINVKFNSAVDQTLAKDLANYAVFTENTSSSDVTKAISLTGSTITLSSDQKTVSIKLANHDVQNGKNYKILVKNLKDMYGNILDTSAEANYTVTVVPTNDSTEAGNVAAPTGVAFMNASGKATIELTFAEELNKVNAENKTGYVVAGVSNQSNIASAVYTPYDATTGKSKVTLALVDGTTLSGTVSVQVIGSTPGVVTDLAGYKLGSTASLTVAVADLVKPTLATITPLVATANTLTTGDTVVLTFSENITTTGNVLDERNYTVKVNGTALSAKANVTAADADTPYLVTASGNQATLTLGSAFANIVKGDIVEVTVAGDKISDLAGLTMDQATASVSTVAGAVNNTAAAALFTDTRTLTVTFAGNGVLASTVGKEDFVVDGNVINAVSVSGAVATLKLAAEVQSGTIVVKPSSTFAIKDDMGNDLTNATLGGATGITTGNAVTVPSTPSAPSLTAKSGDATGLVYQINVPTTQEWSINGTTWTTGTGSAQDVTIPAAGATVSLRVKATGTAQVSLASTTVYAAQAAAPTMAVLTAKSGDATGLVYQLTTAATNEWSVDGTTWTAGNASAQDVTIPSAGATVRFRVKATNTVVASAAATQVFAAQAAAPTSGVTYDIAAGTVTGLGSTYEYSINGGAYSTTATGVTFAAGTFKVRTKATATVVASADQTVATIAAAPALGTITVSGQTATEAILLNGSAILTADGYEYQQDGGAWTSLTTGKTFDLSGNTNLTVRKAATASTLASVTSADLDS